MFYKYTSFAFKIFSSIALLLSIDFEKASITIFLLSAKNKETKKQKKL